MELHKDGDLFAMYFGSENKIKILSINEGEIAAFIHKFENFGTNEGDIEFVGGEDSDKDISFIRKMKFDVNKRYLVGWGDNKVFILNLATKEHEIIKNNSRIYSEICDLNFTSNSDEAKDYTCYVSCSRKDIKQISNFNLMEDIELRIKHDTPFHG
jgi:WD40 repeat protein